MNDKPRLDASAQRMVDAINLINEIAYQTTTYTPAGESSTRESAQRADSIMELHTGDDLDMFAGDLANIAAMMLAFFRRTTEPAAAMDEYLADLRSRIMEMPPIEDQFPPGEYQRLVESGEIPDESVDWDRLLMEDDEGSE